MGQEQTSTTNIYAEKARQAISPPLEGIIQATEEQRQMQRIEVDMTYADHLSRVPALTGTKGKSAAEQEQAKYEAFAKIQAGRELGLQPMESLRAFYFDQNGMGMEIHTRVALALRTGNHRFEIRHLNDTGGEIQWFVKRDGQWHGCTPIKTTIDQLKHIQIWENGKQKPLTDKWNYKSWKEDMIYGFLQRRNIRRYAPETQGSFPVPPADEEVMEETGLRENGHVPSDTEVYGEPATTPANPIDERTPALGEKEAADAYAAEKIAKRKRIIETAKAFGVYARLAPWLKHAFPAKAQMGDLTMAELEQCLTELDTHEADACQIPENIDPATGLVSGPPMEREQDAPAQEALPGTQASAAEARAGGPF